MTTALGPTAQTGVISTQIERVQTDRPAAAEPPRPQQAQAPAEAPPPPPPAESGRGANLDVSA